MALFQLWTGTDLNHQQYLHRGLKTRIVWSRSFYFGLVLVPSLLDLADSLVDPAQKGGC